MDYIFKLILNGIFECRLLLDLGAVQQHGIAIAEKTVFLFHRMTVNAADMLHARKRADEHQQG